MGNNIDLQNERKQTAVLVSVYQGSDSLSLCKEHLEELSLLCDTYGIHPIYKFPCQLKKFDAAYYVTKGKLEEIKKNVDELQPDLIIFDEEISPAQQRNLEKYFQKEVIDRTAVILGVFAQRAQTKEARLQIELAKVRYEAPRLKRLWTHLSRQQATTGGGAYLKGEGEKQIEIDRRILKRKIEQLNEQIKEVKANRETLRTARIKAEIPVFAIVGYTNAGKSTLLNALTQSNVFVEDKLFATLDTTTRKFTLPNNQDILLIDTVGFIRKLPHLLVAAFKSTLEESLQADILLHLVDASHPLAEEQAMTTYEVLKQLGAENKPMITVLNKQDLCPTAGLITKLRIKLPRCIAISALKQTGFKELQEAMMQELSKQRATLNLRIPQSQYQVVAEVLRLGHILKQEYEEDDVLMRVELPASNVHRLKKFII